MTTRLLVLVLLVTSTHCAFSQANFSGFNYQAVVRDGAGEPLANQPITLRVHIFPGLSIGYSETHSVSTDAHGLISVVMGEGTPEVGSVTPTFAGLNWTSGSAMNFDIGIDITGGTNYTPLGSGTFKAVPFAMHALTSGSAANAPDQTLNLSNDTLYLTNGNSVYLGDISDNDWVVSGDTLHNGGKRVGIGTTAPDTTLHVVGKIKYQDGTQADKRMLTSDADGNASWQSLSAESIFGAGYGPAGDISCATNVNIVGTGGSGPQWMTISEGYAYVTNNVPGTMSVFDLSDPANPGLITTIATGGLPGSGVVSGGYAYVVNAGSNDISVFDLSDPAAPALTNTVPAGSAPYAVSVSGGYAYVGNIGSQTMSVFDLSNPAAPVLATTVATGLVPFSIAASGGYAYVVSTSMTNNMSVFDLSDPAVPVLANTITIGPTPQSVTVSGGYAYVVTGSGNLETFDLSNPAAPVLASTVISGSSPRSIVVSGEYAYVVNTGSNSISVFDLSDPAAPELANTVSTGSAPYSVAVSAGYAYVVNFDDDDLSVIKLFCATAVTVDPVTGAFGTRNIEEMDPQVGDNTGDRVPKWNGSALVSGSVADVGGKVGIGTTAPDTTLHVVGKIKYQDGTQADKRILTSDAYGNASWGSLNAQTLFGGWAAPAGALSCLTNSATTPTDGYSVSVAISGNYAYVLNQSNTIKVFDISNPAVPSLIATVATAGNYPIALAISGNYAYAVSGVNNNMMVFDISNPAAPSLINTIPTGGVSIAIAGSYAYVVNTASDNMIVFDISSPSAPGVIATIPTGPNPNCVAVSGNYAYVVDSNSDNMMVFDISNPAVPSLSATISTGLEPICVAVSGNHAYVGNIGSGNMMVFNISNPAVPSLSATIGTGALPWSLAIAGNYAFVVNNGSDNMMVFDISNPAAPSLSATVSTGSQPWSVAVSGGYAYVVNSSGATMSVMKLFCSTTGVTVDPLSGELTTMDLHWEANGSDIRSTNSGNVGIGTLAPLAKFDVVESTGTTGAMAFRLSNPTNRRLEFLSPGSSTTGPWVLNTPNSIKLQVDANDAKSLVLDENGNVGIGTTAPTGKLTVQDDAAGTVQIVGSGNNTNPAEIVFNKTVAGAQHVSATGYGTARGHFIWVNGADRLNITTAGNVGIGTAAPTAKLSVNGTANNSTGSWGVFSDARIKTVHRSFTDGLSVIDRLRPVVFTYNANAPFASDREQVGVIAQELEQVAPYMVTQQENGELCDLREVDNQAYVFLLINAVKELNAMIEAQHAEIEDLRTANAAKDEALSGVRAQLEANTRLLSELQGYLNAQGRK
ncbi:MAG: tail fiber domain-containing protein [Flavobacteriales bacterium]|nr:tail fiber domain-containing protein [Flavobacteriales bacterium]